MHWMAAAAGGETAGSIANRAVRTGREDLASLLNRELFNVSGLGLTVGELIAAILVLVVTWVLVWLLKALLGRYANRHPQTNKASLYTLSRVIQYVLFALGAWLALEVAGVPVGKLGLLAGGLGVGLGFGLQSIFSNFVSGLILLFDKSLKVGDFVELESGVHGEVRDIHIRATAIVTNDNIDILVPNSEFVSGRVVNWTHREVSRRQRIPFGVAYGTDKEVVKQAALEAAAEVPFTLALDGKRKPQVWLTEFGDSSLNFELVVWLTADATKRPSAVKAAYNWALHSALQKYDIEIPFPQQDLHVRSLFGLDGKAALRALKLDAAASDADSNPHNKQAPARNDAVDDVHRAIREDAEADKAAPSDPGEQ